MRVMHEPFKILFGVDFYSWSIGFAWLKHISELQLMFGPITVCIWKED